MLVTVYMTVRNGLPLITEAIKSVKDQTYTDWHMVIVDDGSTDGTAEYLIRLAELDERFQVVLTPGVGRAQALNLAISKAKGEFLANLDADDVYDSRKLEVQVACANRQSSINFLCCRDKEFNDGFEEENFVDFVSAPEVVNNQLKLKNVIGHSTVFIRRTTLQSVGGYDASLRMQIDLELWFRLSARGEALYKQNICLVGKRVHKNQSFENKRRLKYISNAFQLRVRYLKRINAGPKFYLLSFLLLGAGLLPAKFRAWIRQKINF